MYKYLMWHSKVSSRLAHINIILCSTRNQIYCVYDKVSPWLKTPWIWCWDQKLFWLSPGSLTLHQIGILPYSEVEHNSVRVGPGLRKCHMSHFRLWTLVYISWTGKENDPNRITVSTWVSDWQSIRLIVITSLTMLCSFHQKSNEHFPEVLILRRNVSPHQAWMSVHRHKLYWYLPALDTFPKIYF